MDRVQLLLVGLPIFLFCSDLVNLFTPPPAKPAAAVHHHAHLHQQKPSASLLQTPSDPSFIPDPVVNGAGYGTTIEIKFCASCSYRGTAVTMKKMLETSFPGIHVILQNYPPALPKRLLSKLVPVVQFGTIIMITAGDQIFPRLGMAQPAWLLKLRANKFGAIASTWLFGNFAQSFLQSSGAFEVYSNGELKRLREIPEKPSEGNCTEFMHAQFLQKCHPALPKRLLSKLVPVVQFSTIIMITAGDQIFPRIGMAQPAWLLKLRANKFGAIASTWLSGNFAQSFLQSSGAFEVYSNGELVFSKLMEQRFPSEFELRELIGNRLPESQFGKNLGKVWS